MPSDFRGASPVDPNGDGKRIYRSGGGQRISGGDSIENAYAECASNPYPIMRLGQFDA